MTCGPAERPGILLWESADARVRALVARDVLEFRPVTLLGRPGAEAAPEQVSSEVIADRWRHARPEKPTPETDAEFAAAAVSLGMVDGAVGGVATDSAAVLRAGLRYVGASGTVSMAMLAEPPLEAPGGRAVVLADCAVVPHPTAEQLADIAIASADTWQRIQGSPARIAFIAATTRSSVESEETIRISRALRMVSGRRPDLRAEGELQLDAALVPAIAEMKASAGHGDGRERLGAANVLVFPNLVAANSGYKLLQHLAGYEITPITQQLRKPFFDLSRGCTVTELHSAAKHCGRLAQSMNNRGSFVT